MALSCIKQDLPLCTKMMNHQGTKDISLAFQHLGGSLSALPNGQKKIFIHAILNNYSKALKGYHNVEKSLNVTKVTLNESSTKFNKQLNAQSEHQSIY